MISLPYWVYPRYWINRWKALRFAVDFGPDSAVVRARDFDIVDMLEEAVRNWDDEGRIRLPHRYRHLLERIELLGNEAECELFWAHKALAKDVVQGLMYYEACVKKREPYAPTPDSWYWLMRPQCLAGFDEKLRRDLAQFEADFALARKHYLEACYWLLEVPKIRVQMRNKDGGS